MAKEMMDWRTLLSFERTFKKKMLQQAHNVEDREFRALEVAEWANADLPIDPKPLLQQVFEGVVTDFDERFVTVAFEMDHGKEHRRFSRAIFQEAQIRVNDIVELHCKLIIPSPTPPLTDDQIEKWEARHADFAAAQEKTKRARPLDEDMK